mgnify:CR=1 FL=1
MSEEYKLPFATTVDEGLEYAYIANDVFGEFSDARDAADKALHALKNNEPELMKDGEKAPSFLELDVRRRDKLSEFNDLIHAIGTSLISPEDLEIRETSD